LADTQLYILRMVRHTAGVIRQGSRGAEGRFFVGDTAVHVVCERIAYLTGVRKIPGRGSVMSLVQVDHPYRTTPPKLAAPYSEIIHGVTGYSYTKRVVSSGSYDTCRFGCRAGQVYESGAGLAAP
jgi:hypothetical protein